MAPALLPRACQRDGPSTSMAAPAFAVNTSAVALVPPHQRRQTPTRQRLRRFSRAIAQNVPRPIPTDFRKQPGGLGVVVRSDGCRFVHMDAKPPTSVPDRQRPESADVEAESRVHDELRAIARAVLRGRRCPGLLQTTALVHEAWMRLRGFDLSRLDRRSSRFAALAAKTLRSVLVDEARHEARAKRGGDWLRLEIASNDIEAPRPLESVELLCLDEAMRELAALNSREATVVELRFFGGMTIDQVAEHMGFSARTIESDWEHARAWLRVRLDGMIRGSG